jgi:hypothetical protein
MGFGDHDQAPVATRVADMGEANACVAGRALDHGTAGPQLTRLVCRLDDSQSGSVLDRIARVQELRLAQDLSPGLLAEPFEADQRRVSNGADEAGPNVHRCSRTKTEHLADNEKFRRIPSRPCHTSTL